MDLMPFLKHVALTLVVSVDSFISATLGFLHAPTANDKALPSPSPAVQITSHAEPIIATTSPPKIISARKDEIAITAPTEDARVYQGTGYSISIPTNFLFGVATGSIYSIAPNPSKNYDTWHSSDMTKVIGVQWELDSTNSQIRRLEETQLFYANLAKTKPQMTPVTVSHPTIDGAASSTMFEKPVYPASYGVYLFVTGSNGNIYLIYGILSTVAARTSVKQIVESFSF
jgi:hypothetical protein